MGRSGLGVAHSDFPNLWNRHPFALSVEVSLILHAGTIVLAGTAFALVLVLVSSGQACEKSADLILFDSSHVCSGFESMQPAFAAVGHLLCSLLVLHILSYRWEEARRELREDVSQLQFDSLTAADCSDDADKKRILEALAGREGEVEAALQILMKQGIYRHVYKDTRSSFLALVIWPSYLCCAAWELNRGSVLLGRVTWSGLCMGTICYTMCFWAHLRSDVDLVNLIMRAGCAGICLILLCGGLLLDLQGMVGGVALAACIVAHGSRHVQHSELQKFIDNIMPLAVLCWAFLTWEVFAILTFDTCCICVWHELAGISGFFFMWACATRVSMRWWNRDQMAMFWASTFLASACANSCLISACLVLPERQKWLLAQEGDSLRFSKVLDTHISLRGRCIWSSCWLLIAGLTYPLWLACRDPRRHPQGQREQETPVIELALMQ